MALCEACKLHEAACKSGPRNVCPGCFCELRWNDNADDKRVNERTPAAVEEGADEGEGVFRG